MPVMALNNENQHVPTGDYCPTPEGPMIGIASGGSARRRSEGQGRPRPSRPHHPQPGVTGQHIHAVELRPGLTDAGVKLIRPRPRRRRAESTGPWPAVVGADGTRLPDLGPLRRGGRRGAVAAEEDAPEGTARLVLLPEPVEDLAGAAVSPA
jgi:hypothetical protein